MSEHLWLYEGMTEYAAHHAQVKSGIIEMNDFLNTMMQKYENSVENYNDTMSFTYMSKHVLEKKIHKQYNNVYEKGAVIGMCLDILLRDLSHGQYGTQLLMKDLSKRYGKDKSFKDADLFKDIEELTFPEVGEFLRKHVGGKEPLPMESILKRVGVLFQKEETVLEYSLGNPDLDYNENTKRLYVAGAKNLDEFGKALGYKKGDEFKSLNGKEIQIETLRELIRSYYEDIREGQDITITVYRKTWRKGHFKQKTLTAKARKVKVIRKNQLSILPEVTEQQKETMRTWIGI
jgi:predicted metalloprotease with PDZ domain